MSSNIKILLIMPVSIGDIVLTTPIIKSLRNKYPSSHISYAVQNGAYAQVLENNIDIDKLILLNKNYIDIIKNGDYMNAILDEIGDINKYDLIINFRDKDGQVKQKDLYNRHVVYYFANKANVKVESIRPNIYIDKYHEDEANSLLGEFNFDKNKKLIVIAPYCGFSSNENEHRKWPTDNFIFLMGKLQEKYNANFVVIGAKNDKEITFNRTINVMGYHLMTVASIISKCDLFIGVDSGVTHMAAAFNVPIIDILFPGLPELWCPASDEKFVVFSSRRVIRRFTSITDLKKEVVLKYTIKLLDGKLNKSKFVRFYPKINLFKN
jgi:ADP-heptose:LPS heptosyltransferase